MSRQVADLFNAVSAGFISREDLFSEEAAAKIRVRIGCQLYLKKLDKEISFLNFAYNAVYFALAVVAENKAETISQRNRQYYEAYCKAYNAIYDLPEAEIKEPKNELAELYDYLFKK